MFIYLVTNKINGKQYVGQTRRSIEKRFIGHTEKGSALHSAIKKYGKESFSIRELGRYEDIQDLNNAEEYFISFHNCIAPFGYNLTTGGEGGFFRTEETKEKISTKKKGVPNPKLSAVLKGRHCSPRTEFKKGQTRDQRGEKNHMFGKPAHNRGKPAYTRGMKWGPESIAKMSAARKAYWDRKKAAK